MKDANRITGAVFDRPRVTAGRPYLEISIHTDKGTAYGITN